MIARSEDVIIGIIIDVITAVIIVTALLSASSAQSRPGGSEAKLPVMAAPASFSEPLALTIRAKQNVLLLGLQTSIRVVPN